MLIRSPAILCSVLPHGEHGAIARALTPDHGLLAGYVRGGRSRRLRPVLMAGNSLETEYRARTEGQLPALVVELTHSRGALLDEPLPAAAIDWLCALTAVALLSCAKRKRKSASSAPRRRGFAGRPQPRRHVRAITTDLRGEDQARKAGPRPY